MIFPFGQGSGAGIFLKDTNHNFSLSGSLLDAGVQCLIIFQKKSPLNQC